LPLKYSKGRIEKKREGKKETAINPGWSNPNKIYIMSKFSILIQSEHDPYSFLVQFEKRDLLGTH
jgi:hypothetical protein